MNMRPLLKSLLLSLLLVNPAQVPAQSLSWEDPRELLAENARFPRAVSGRNFMAVVWQEFVRRPLGKNEIYLSLLTSSDGRSWQRNERFAGPFAYQGRDVPIYSLAVDRDNRILAAVSADKETVSVLASEDGGATFAALSEIKSRATSLAPTISVASDGSLLLFVTDESGDFLSLYYSNSENGRIWDSFQPLVPAQEGLVFNFLPSHSAGGSTDYLVFQGLRSEDLQSKSYQLYLKTSLNGGRTWGRPRQLSFLDPEEQALGLQETEIANQRPFLKAWGDGLGLVWERQRGARPPQIYYAALDANGGFRSTPGPVSAGGSEAFSPRLIRRDGSDYVLWFDRSEGNERVFLASRENERWRAVDLSGRSMALGNSMFPMAVFLGTDLYIFWEYRLQDESKLIILQPDQSVETPALRAVNFDPLKASRQEEVRISWVEPRDSSGIDGYDFSWGRSRWEPMAHDSDPQRVKLLSGSTSQTLRAEDEGIWYFRLAVRDKAGNWSEPAALSYRRDLTPPPPLEFLPPEVDPEGYLAANTFTLSWRPGPGEEPAGYSYALQYLGPVDAPYGDVRPAAPADSPQLARPGLALNNLDNGLWTVAAAALDEAGNMSPVRSIAFRLNKYIPVTSVTNVSAAEDPDGTLRLRILGRGFAEGGNVERVLLDRDGREPYDHVFSRREDLYTVQSDRLIDGPALSDVEEGLYRVGVDHPLRGLHFSRSLLQVTSQGTVKFGNFDYTYTPPWVRVGRAAAFLSANAVVVYVVILFLGLLMLVSTRKLAVLAREGRVLQLEMTALLEGRAPLAKKEVRMEELRRRGVSLRLKFTMLTMVLVLITVAMVSVPLSFYMVNTQRKNLAEGLANKAEVLLGSLTAGSESMLQLSPDQINTLDLTLLLQQASAMNEARFATIQGKGVADTDRFDYLWATTNPDLDAKREAQNLDWGEYLLEDLLSPGLQALKQEVNARGAETIGALAEEYYRYIDEQLALLRSRDEASQQRAAELAVITQELNARINDELSRIGLVFTRSFPAFDVFRLEPFYTFYRPILYRERGKSSFYRGVVRLNVSTETIRAEIVISRRNLMIRTAVIALVAAGLGLVGAIVMASITITPIRKLAQGVAVIRDTPDKADLEHHEIDVTSRDEIGMLATTVNQMTQALVKAAIANKDLILGKEVQKMFIPLDKDERDRKGTTGGESNENVEIYGYYEGAKGVSGDYFDYVKLTNKHYAVIKCDVAGKGVPAALIMVEVSTIFSAFFQNWTLKDPGMKIERLVYQINDMLEKRGFKGRFAALTVCIINAESGEGYYCNAGDTNLHFFDRALGRMKEIKLPEAPAAGVFPSDLVELQAGFKQVAHRLTRGDTLFLFTDGIEEAQRSFRDSQYLPVTCQEQDLAENASHGGTHSKGSGKEELGIPRIYEIINAVFNRQVYRLEKYHSPLPGEELSFDFTSCEGSVAEAVLALVSVEKVFRIYPDPGAGADDTVKVDPKIDAFLEKHFSRYAAYFSHRLESEEGPDQVTYSHLKEDEQYDDLTILALRKR
jgi:HAMP domain-containing protein